MTVTLDIFWTVCTAFYNKISSFDTEEFIWRIKDIRDGNNHLWYTKYSLSCTEVLPFVACRVISKILVIGVAERSCGDVETTKSG